MRFAVKLFAFIGLLMKSIVSVADIAVVGNDAFPVASISKDTAMQIFLKKRSDIEGHRVRVLDLPKGDVRQRFYILVANRPPDNMLAYWYRLMFTGKGEPPEIVTGVDDMLLRIAQEKHVIGYIDAASVNDKVKVLLLLKE